jgi:hypothetical protein
MRLFLIAAATAALALPGSAGATKFPGKNREATFRVSVQGVQTTTWSENHQSTGTLCDSSSHGSGSERIVFSSRPVVIKAWQFMGAGRVVFTRGTKPATLPGRGSVTRNGKLERSDVDPRCAVGDGDGDGTTAPPASDCGRKVIGSLPLMLGWDPSNSKRIMVVNDSSKSGPPFENCPVSGDAWTTLLRWDDKKGTAGEELPAADLFDKRQGKMLVLGKGTVKRSDSSRGSASTTRVQWTLTLTRLRR